MLIGKILKGRYRLYDQLGVGGSAAVFLARDTGTGRISVVKIIHPHLVEGKFIARFLREIKILQQVSSKHIVEIYDYGLNHTQPDLPAPVSFIAMEYVEGLTVTAIIERISTFSEPNTLALAAQLASALDALYRLGVVHRDIKSQNVMVTADNTAKIFDFGVAKNLAEQTITGTDVFAGTLSYASPEQLKDSRNVDIRSDIYSLGVVLAECLTGKVPPRNRKGQHIYLDQRPDATTPSRSRTTPATNAAEIIQRCLSLDPDHRYQSPADLLTNINQVASGKPLSLPWDTLGVRAVASGAGTPAVSDKEARCYLLTPTGEKIGITRREVVIGRSAPGDSTWIPDVDVRQLNFDNAKTVSRFHCRLFAGDGGTYQVLDMGSFNGTWVNGRRLDNKETVTLSNGDEVQVGAIKFTFHMLKVEGAK